MNQSRNKLSQEPFLFPHFYHPRGLVRKNPICLIDLPFFLLHLLPLLFLLQSLLSKGRQDKASLVDLGVVVAAEALLFLGGPGAQGLADVAAGLLAAHHEADLARGVCRDRGVGVLGHGEDLAALLLQLSDQRQVKPLVLS